MDLDFLRPLYDGPGGCLGYLDTARDHENAAREIAVRWQDARERLASAGADEPTLDAVAEAVGAEPVAPGRAAFGRGGALRLTETLPATPRREIARVAPLPHVMPLLAQRSPHVPHLRVTARHDGGDVVTVSAASAADEEEVISTGSPVRRRPAAAGPSCATSAAPRRRRRPTPRAGRAGDADAGRIGADSSWSRRPVARTLLVRQLGTDLAARTCSSSARSRGQRGGARAANQASPSTSGSAAGSASRAGGPSRLMSAVAGLPTPWPRCATAQSANLLVDHPESADAAWIGPNPADLGSSAAELTERGIADPVTERRDAALARAAAMASAQLYFLTDPDPCRSTGSGGCVSRTPAPADR